MFLTLADLEEKWEMCLPYTLEQIERNLNSNFKDIP